MLSLIVEFALFFLVLFFVVPALMVTLMIARDLGHRNRKLAGWHRDETGKLAGQA
ncbi:MAG: hypothetical protein R3E50_07020 [Halioglobus sp.]